MTPIREEIARILITEANNYNMEKDWYRVSQLFLHGHDFTAKELADIRERFQ